MKISLGFSPCPNDTFIFDALVNKKIDTKDLEFEIYLEDVATLNQWAIEGKLDVTKLSYSTFLHTFEKYALLQSGSALGKGVGPLVIAAKEENGNLNNEAWRKTARIAIPGKNTTANLLLSLAFPDIVNKTELIFSAIEEAVKNEHFDAGLIIHESRFTYESKGLKKWLDLGDWWEKNTGAAIPLGGIVANRNLGKDLINKIDHLILESLEYAWENYPKLAPFVVENAQEMSEDVMRQHINLYVNAWSKNLGDEGKKAIIKLFEKASKSGIIKSTKSDKWEDLIFN